MKINIEFFVFTLFVTMEPFGNVFKLLETTIQKLNGFSFQKFHSLRLSQPLRHHQAQEQV